MRTLILIPALLAAVLAGSAVAEEENCPPGSHPSAVTGPVHGAHEELEGRGIPGAEIVHELEPFTCVPDGR